ncbi:MAG: GNAT family N-acetyltransferase [Nonlabens sp.]
MIKDNKERKRFELPVEDQIAYIEYIKAKGNIYLTHTEVPSGLEGKGIGSKMVLAVLEHIESEDLVLVPLCPFVASYIKRHPEWRRLVYRGTDLV